MPILTRMPVTMSVPLLCTSKIRSIVFGESSRTPSTSPPQATADQVAVGKRVVARGRPGLPPGRLRRQHGGGLVPVVHVLEGDRLVPARDARGVRQQVADLDPRLAPGRELGPVFGDVRVKVEVA